jgi:hypothetical protein
MEGEQKLARERERERERQVAVLTTKWKRMDDCKFIY